MVFAVLAALVAQANPLTARVQAAYDAQCADIMHSDWAALESTYSPNFVADQNGRTYTRSDIVAAVKQSQAQGIQFSSCTTSVDNVAQTPNNPVLVVVARQTLNASQGGHAVVIAYGRRDMWTPQGAVLLQTSSTPLWVTVTEDGRIVQQFGDIPSPSPSTPPRRSGS